jgi:hypothetical protein
LAAEPVLKVVVTHRAAARAKYGPYGWRRIRRAVTELRDADVARGITTRFFALDSAADCNRVAATRVDNPADTAAVKASIDRIYATWNPAYLLLLGGPELVAQPQLGNSLWTGDPYDDADPSIPSDLPYACDVPFSEAVSAFRGPTRAVGRMPDLVGLDDEHVLLSQLANATRQAPATAGAPTGVFALSTRTWRVSTQLSVGKLPGATGKVRTCPAEGPAWTGPDLAPLVHLVNCHGGEFEPRWFGENRAGQLNLPVSMDSALLPGLVAPGTVVAAECCYGSSHWPPAAVDGRISVAMSYLLEGAGGVFGASTIAYGPAAANDYADVLCRLFLEEVLGGASLGRAALTARQRYIQGQSFLDPTDLKTLAQFDLLGDPSVHSIAPPAQPADSVLSAPKAARSVAKSVRTSTPRVPPGVLARRALLSAVGDALGRTAIACHDTARRRAGVSVDRLADLLGGPLPAGTRIRSFDSSRPGAAPRAAMRRRARTPSAHVAFVPPGRRTAKSLVVLRTEPGADTEIRVVVPR